MDQQHGGLRDAESGRHAAEKRYRNPFRSAPGAVLLIRVNSGPELVRTQGAVQAVRNVFPGCTVTALATPQTETLSLLQSDPEIDSVLLFPPAGAPLAQKSPVALRRFMRSQRFQATVVCCGGTPGFDYRRHLLSVLLCPKPRYLMMADRVVFPATGARGRSLLARAALALFAERLRLLAIRLRTQSKSEVIPWNELRRILWIRLDQIGDVAMSLPALHFLKTACPDAAIDVLVRPECASLFDAVPDVAHVIEWKETTTALPAAGPYDLAIETRGDDAARRMARVSGAHLRLGPERGPYERPGTPNQAHLMNALIPAGSAGHAVEANFALLEAAGLKPLRSEYRLRPPDCMAANVRKALESRGVTGPYAVVHARPGQPTKEWATNRFAAVADHLRRMHGLFVVLTGGASDSAYNQEIVLAAEVKPAPVNVAGVFSLAELAALYESARIVVTVDTGPMHIAAFTGAPLVALFLPWFSGFHSPYGQEDSVLHPRSGYTLAGIAVEEVTTTIDRKMKPEQQGIIPA